MVRKLFLILLLFIGITARGNTVIINGISYSLEDNPKAAMVVPSEDKPYTGNIVIPATVTYQGIEYPVKGIASGTFSGTDVTGVTLPESIVVIDKAAFTDEYHNKESKIREKIVLGHNVELYRYIDAPYLTRYNFYKTGLGKIDWKQLALHHNNVIYGKLPTAPYDFIQRGIGYKITGKNEVAVVSTGVHLYTGTTLNIPSTVTYKGVQYKVTQIKNGAFSESANLTSATISEGITQIGDLAFFACSKLQKVVLPQTLTSLGNGTFMLCEALTQINIPDRLHSILRATFESSGLETIDLPASVDTILASAFSNSQLQRINLQNVKFIGHYAFAVTYIESADLSSVRNIGDGLFAGCDRLKTVTMSPYVPFISKAMFMGTAIEYVDMPACIDEIQECGFSDCKRLKRIDLQNVTLLGKSVFSGCTSLTDVSMDPASIHVATDNAEDVAKVFQDVPWFSNLLAQIEAEQRAELQRRTEAEQMAQQEALREAQQARKQSKLDLWCNVLNAVSSAGNAYLQSQNYGTRTRSTTSASTVSPTVRSSNSGTSSSNNRNSTSAAMLANRNMAQRTYNKYGSMLCSAFYGNGFYKNTPLSKVREWQSEMRSIRVEWENKGYSFYQSPWETKDFSNRR
jgi:hypothetical protein